VSNRAGCIGMTELQTKRVKIVVNGEERSVPADQNVRSVLAALGIEADRVAVELDRGIVRKADWESTAVTDGSRLEIVQFVGGG
jgi:sulfur carrier protein